MKQNRLLSLELEKNQLRPYNIAVIISTICALGFIYFMAAIPRIDAADQDVKLFNSYVFVINLSLVVMMGTFIMISAAMSSKFIVDEYRGSKAILLLTYPIEREKILRVKIALVILYTFITMFIGGICIISIFMITESLFPISKDSISSNLILRSVMYLVVYAFISGSCGVISAWIGFRKKSVIATIIGACVIVLIICQIAGMIFYSMTPMVFLLLIITVLTILISNNMVCQVKEMEI